MTWFSERSGFAVGRDGDAVWVRGPGCEAELSGSFANQFVEAFLSSSEGLPDHLQRLLRILPDPHRRALEAARKGGGHAWVPLQGWGTDPTLFLELLGRCNERCVHCYADASPEVADLIDRDLALRVIAEGAHIGFERLQLTGGDPLLCPDLEELVTAGYEAGFRTVEIYTNGLALTAERLNALAERNALLAFSFYSVVPTVHDAITRVPGSCERTLEAIRTSVQRGVRVRAAIVSMETNGGTIEATFQKLVDLGVPPRSISVSEVRSVGRGRSQRPPPQEIAPAHTATASDDPPARLRRPGKLCVSYTGDVFPCIFSRALPLGNVRSTSLATIVERTRSRAHAPGIALAPSRLSCFDCQLTASTLE